MQEVKGRESTKKPNKETEKHKPKNHKHQIKPKEHHFFTASETGETKTTPSGKQLVQNCSEEADIPVKNNG